MMDATFIEYATIWMGGLVTVTAIVCASWVIVELIRAVKK
jgi:hypothetical protein